MLAEKEKGVACPTKIQPVPYKEVDGWLVIHPKEYVDRLTSSCGGAQ